MALITEDGTGKADAESYCSVADADTWHGNRGAAAWAALSTTQKEQALRRATDFMVGRYRSVWAGTRYTSTQALDWPRAAVPMLDGPGGYGDYPAYYPEPSLPAAVRNACAELALKASAGELAPDVGRVTTREKVDVVEVQYADGAPAWTTYRGVENMLSPFMRQDGGTMMKLVRA